MARRHLFTLLLLTAALAACSAKSPDAPWGATGATAKTRAAPPAADAGERIYSGNCAPCHQPTGTGIPGVYPSLSHSPVVVGDPAELALWVIKGRRPASMPAGRYPTQMLLFSWLKPADAAALFSYLRTNFGNSAAAVDATAVSKALAQ